MVRILGIEKILGIRMRSVGMAIVGIQSISRLPSVSGIPWNKKDSEIIRKSSISKNEGYLGNQEYLVYQGYRIPLIRRIS